jgi:PKD repeat protein
MFIMKTLLHPIFAASVLLLGSSLNLKAQNQNESSEALAYESNSDDFLGTLTAEYESARVNEYNGRDLEIKSSAVYVDLGSEQEVEFSARTGWADQFVWKFGDGKITSGVQHVKHRFSKPGKYKVTLIAANSEQSAKKQIEVTVVDSRKPLELEEMEHFIVFPRNNKLETDIKLNLPKRERKLRFQVQDIKGNQVFEHMVGRVGKKETIRVDLQNIPDGKYYAVLKGKKYSMVSRLSVVR